jgi:hypothetical protein
MKTAKEWAEYLPLDIKLWFIEECESEGSKLNNLYDSLLECVWQEFDWANTELGYDFWSGVKELCLKYKDREADILKDLEWIDDLLEWIDDLDMGCQPIIEVPFGKCDFSNKRLKLDVVDIQVLELDKSNLKLLCEVLVKENTELKETHSQIIQGLATENNNLKARCEALEIRNEVLSIEKLTLLEEFTALQVKTKEYQDMVISFLKTDLEAGKEELTYWQQLKQLFGCN